MTLNRNQLEALAKLIRHGALERAGKVLDRIDPAEIPELLRSFGPAEQQGLVGLLFAPRRAGWSLRNVPEPLLRGFLERVDDQRLARLAQSLPVDDAVWFLDLLPLQRVGPVFALIDPTPRLQIERALTYAPTAAGRLMTTECLSLPEVVTAQQAIDLIRTRAEETETVSYLYTVDAEGRLKGIVPFWRLVAAKPERALSELVDPDPIYVKASDDQELAADLTVRNGLLSLPVVDDDRRLLGVITVDDIVDVVRDEATEDMQKIGGMEALDAPYLEIGLRSMIRKRAGWLCILFVGEMLTATAMGQFEDEIAKAVVLSLFIPLIISSGGNSGSQASTLVIRAMALGEVRLRDWWKVIRREVFSGLALGSILGMIGMARILLWSMGTNLYGPHYMLIAGTIFLSLIGVVLFGTMAGSMLPFLLKRLGLDPASASAPFVATMVDVTGLVIYFSVARLMLFGTLL
jgi:magnesium transporter